MSELQKRTWAEISLDNIEHNYRAVKAGLPAGCRYLGVVKADAYGHGALPVAHRLEKAGADYLAVSCLDEALELRRGGVAMPILILGHTPVEYLPELLENNVTQTVSCLAKAVEYSEAAVKYGGTLRIHIKLDTGMSRLGFLCAGRHFDEGVDGVTRSCMLPNLDPEGVYTHFAVSDEPGADNRAYTLAQFDLFNRVIAGCAARGVTFRIRHCANSGAVVNYPGMALDMVRPGLTLYGYGDAGGRLGLRPAMRLVTTVSTVKIYDPGTDVSYGRRFRTDRPTRMGVVGIGYADGLFRAASNKCAFWTPHGFAPQRGTICMDMCMLDLTDLPDVTVGDEIEIFGANADINALAAAAGTISYELLCGVSRRVPRVYRD